MKATNETKKTALNAFMAAKAELDALIDTLTQQSDDHFGLHPDNVNWGHVGTLSDVVSDMRKVVNNE